MYLLISYLTDMMLQLLTIEHRYLSLYEESININSRLESERLEDRFRTYDRGRLQVLRRLRANNVLTEF